MSASIQPEPGQPAPQFEAPVTSASGVGTFRLSDFAGKTVVLYFYPKDDTPGCTTQACGLRDNWKAFEGKAEIFGVSIDAEESHTKFINKFTLPFPLISDTDKSIVEKYGVWVEKSMMGKAYMGTERTTFVVGPDQTILGVFRKVNPAEHVDKLLALLNVPA